MKRAVCFILTLLILTLCACKDEEPNSSTADTLTNADISVLPDDEKDPENREENEIGSRVEAETIKVKKGVAHGIDVSKWQGKIDWQKVAKSGIIGYKRILNIKPGKYSQIKFIFKEYREFIEISYISVN